MKGRIYNSKQIEEWATTAVKDYLSMTDTLSQFIKENDKTPSWDGDVLIFKSNATSKKDIIGKIAVQVKGEMADNIDREECSFSVDMADLVNYRNDGGTIYFVVLISKDNPRERKVFYDTLTPLKIVSYIQGHELQNSRTIKLKMLPDDKFTVQTIFYNFYHDSHKQHSFSSITPIRLEELSSRKDIVKVSSKISVYAPEGKTPSLEQAFLNNDVYWYAEIENSNIPHPIAWYPEMALVSKEGFPPVFVNGERYDNYISRTQTKNNTTIQFGESTKLIFTATSKRAKMEYKPSSSLKNRIKDLGFVISIVENGEIELGGNRKLVLGEMVADAPFDLAFAKRELKAYKRVEQFWNSLQIKEDFDIENIDSNSSVEELHLLMKSINGRRTIHINTDGEQDHYLFRKSISNFNILFFLDSVDKEKCLYKIYNFYDYQGVLKIVRGDKEHITSRYSVFTPDDYIELSNINLSKMLQSYKDLMNLNSNMYEPANYDLLNLLLAYDKHSGHPREMLNTATEMASWLLNESGDNLPTEIKLINYLQTIKRERDLTIEENRKLYEIAENANSSLMFRLGANLLLENNNVARIQFEKLSDQDKEEFRSFPIYKYWK